MKVSSKDGDTARVESKGIEMEVSVVLTPDVMPGDYVIVHAGFAISSLSAEEAEETLQIFDRLEKSWETPS